MANAKALFIAGQTGTCFDSVAGGMVVSPDVLGQVGTAWDKIRSVLDADGRDLSSLQRVDAYVRTDVWHLAANLDALLPTGISSTTHASIVPVTRLLHPEALVEVEGFASNGSESGAMARWQPSVMPTIAVAFHDTSKLGAALDEATERMSAALGARGLDWRSVVRARFFVVGHEVCLSPPSASRHYGAPPAMLRVPGTSDGFRGIRLEALVVPPPVGHVRAGGMAGVDTGPLLYLAGPVGTKGPTDVMSSLERAYEELRTILENEDSQVIQTVEFVAKDHVDEYRRTAAVRRRHLAPPWPVATGVICDAVGSESTPVWIEAVVSRTGFLL